MPKIEQERKVRKGKEKKLQLLGMITNIKSSVDEATIKFFSAITHEKEILLEGEDTSDGENDFNVNALSNDEFLA